LSTSPEYGAWRLEDIDCGLSEPELDDPGFSRTGDDAEIR
jgi:hypothetical protein